MAKTKATGDGLTGSVTHLLHRALQLALDFHAEAAGAGSVTQRQHTVLSAVRAAEGLTQNDLVRATGIDRSTLADLVARMLTKGLLERERSASDARANAVRLSQTGQLVLVESAAAAAAADARLLALLAPKKRDAFLKTLASLGAIADAPDAASTVKSAKREAKASPPAKATGKAARLEKKKKKKAKKAKDIGA